MPPKYSSDPRSELLQLAGRLSSFLYAKKLKSSRRIVLIMVSVFLSPFNFFYLKTFFGVFKNHSKRDSLCESECIWKRNEREREGEASVVDVVKLFWARNIDNLDFPLS